MSEFPLTLHSASIQDISPLSKLPAELILQLLKALSTLDALHLTQTCKWLYQFRREPTLFGKRLGISYNDFVAAWMELRDIPPSAGYALHTLDGTTQPPVLHHLLALLNDDQPKSKQIARLKAAALTPDLFKFLLHNPVLPFSIAERPSGFHDLSIEGSNLDNTVVLNKIIQPSLHQELQKVFIIFLIDHAIEIFFDTQKISYIRDLSQLATNDVHIESSTEIRDSIEHLSQNFYQFMMQLTHSTPLKKIQRASHKEAIHYLKQLSADMIQPIHFTLTCQKDVDITLLHQGFLKIITGCLTDSVRKTYISHTIQNLQCRFVCNTLISEWSDQHIAELSDNHTISLEKEEYIYCQELIATFIQKLMVVASFIQKLTLREAMTHSTANTLYKGCVSKLKLLYILKVVIRDLSIDLTPFTQTIEEAQQKNHATFPEPLQQLLNLALLDISQKYTTPHLNTLSL